MAAANSPNAAGTATRAQALDSMGSGPSVAVVTLVSVVEVSVSVVVCGVVVALLCVVPVSVVVCGVLLVVAAVVVWGEVVELVSLEDVKVAVVLLV
jgi:hypothetical protein